MKKTKLLIRSMALLISVLMTVSMIACSKDDADATESSEESSDSVETSESEEKLELPDVNYDGATFTILGRSGHNGEYKNDLDITELTTQTTAIDKAVYQRNQKVEKTYGVDIILITEEDTKLNSTVMNTVATGDDTYDVVATHGRYVFQLIVGGNASEIHDFEYIDLEKSWWLGNLEEVWSTPGGKLFAINGDISYIYIGCMGGIYFNKSVLNNANITLPYEHVRNGTWYFSTYKQMLIDVSESINGDGSGVIGQDTFAYIAEQYRGPGTIIESTGVETLVLGGDGTYSIGVKTQIVYDAADEYETLLKQPYAHLVSNSDLGVMRNEFGNGRAIFIEDNIKEAPKFKQKGIDFGLVPIYRYNDTVGDLNLCIGSGTNTFMIPKTVPESNRERVGVVLEAMAYYGQKIMIPAYYDKILSYQSMQSPDDLEMLHLIHDSARVDLAEYLNPGNIKGTLFAAIESNTDFSTGIAGIGKAALVHLDSWYALDKK